VGVVQPILDKDVEDSRDLSVFSTGTLGQITEISEAFEGSVSINISGICRFDIEGEHEVQNNNRYAVANYERYLQDLQEVVDVKINRKKLLQALESYFRQYDVAPNWQEIDKTTDENLITVLSMVCPFHAREKQALLETPNLAMQSEMITRLIEFAKFDSVVSSATRH
jgi:Lon protease-like protein